MRKLFTAIAFLSRLPIPFRLQVKSDKAFALVVNYLGLAGLCLGLINVLLAWVLFSLLPTAMAATVLTFAVLLINGALHEDGFADFFDAIGARSPDKRLEIMKDSRIGAFGTLALIGTCLARIQIYSYLAALHVEYLFAFLLFVSGWSRWLATFFMKRCEYVHKNGKGLAAGWQNPSGLGLVLTAFLFLMLSFLWVPYIAASLTIVVLLEELVLPFVFKRFLRGVNGDCLGFSAVLCELLSGVVAVGLLSAFVA
jgi:adenosylcobinamide-GDP ribazoletransferase